MAETSPYPTDPPSRFASLPFYYGWGVMFVAAFAMVGTLPGRTQGLGLITESLLKSLGMSRVEYANINLWATLIGSLFCIGIGTLLDRQGSRRVLTAVVALLGIVVVLMSQVTTVSMLAVLITLTRGFGQSALSVVSLEMVGKWFSRRLSLAMALYAVVMTIGFMIAFPLVGWILDKSGWRVAWGGIGWTLLLVLLPVAALLTRRSPQALGLPLEQEFPQEAAQAEGGCTLGEALRTPAFWVIGFGSALYGLIASGIGLFNESILAERGFAPAVYRTTLAVTALTGLLGNFLGGAVTARRSMSRLMSVAMLLMMVGLIALTQARTLPQILSIAVVMGLAGGFVTVIFFAFWAKVYGRAHLGRIQGAAQMLTVLASAIGPLLLARCVEWTHSYAAMFWILALVVALAGIAAYLVPVPEYASDSFSS